MSAGYLLISRNMEHTQKKNDFYLQKNPNNAITKPSPRTLDKTVAVQWHSM